MESPAVSWTEADIERLHTAYLAAEKSKDPSTQIGAVLIGKSGRIVCHSQNKYPAAIRDTKELWERPTKDAIIHAEVAVIYQAARTGIRTQGLTMYCTWAACEKCSFAMIEAGIEELVTHDIPEYKTHPTWKASVEAGLARLREAGVRCRFIDRRLGGLRVRLNGEVIEV